MKSVLLRQQFPRQGNGFECDGWHSHKYRVHEELELGNQPLRQSQGPSEVDLDRHLEIKLKITIFDSPLTLIDKELPGPLAQTLHIQSLVHGQVRQLAGQLSLPHWYHRIRPDCGQM